MRPGNRLVAVCKGDWERADVDVVYLVVNKNIDVNELINTVPRGKMVEALKERYNAKDAGPLELEVLWD